MIFLPQEYKIKEYVILLTAECNLNCLYCYQKNIYQQQGKIKFPKNYSEDLAAFIKQTADPAADSFKISFFGGEPLIYFDDLVNIVTILSSKLTKPPVFSITTNLTLADKKKLDFLIENQFVILVSLDGKKQSHELNRGKNTFEQIIRNLSYLYAKGARVNIRMTISKNNIKDFAENVNFINSFNIPYIWFFDTNQKYSPQELETFLRNYLEVSKSNKRWSDQTINYFGSRLNKPIYCIDPFQTVHIRWDGKIVLCSGLDWQVGDINSGISKKEDLGQIPMFNKKISADKCHNCLTYAFCKGGCLAEHVNYTQEIVYDYNLKKSFCDIQRLIHLIIAENYLKQVK